ncbi:hypothetical protein DIPPA_23446 [Diplonema papillatum]|nr:hypothetical protein DIPPA_23446 [Diplonema papillatum]
MRRPDAMLTELVRLVTNPSDSMEELERKRHAVAMASMVGLFALLSIIVLIVVETSVFIFATSLGACIFGSTWLLGAMWLTKRISQTTIIVTITCYSFSIICLDLNALIQSGSRMWPLFVIVLDFLLVLRADRTISKAIIFVFAIWIATTLLEDTLRFGLYDLPGTVPYADRRSRVNVDCNELPCKKLATNAIPAGVSQVFVLLLDYYFTRRFAEGLFREQAYVNVAIRAIERVAERAAILDTVGAVHELSQCEQQLPKGIFDSLQDILQAITEYKSYVPMSNRPAFWLANDEDGERTTELTVLAGTQTRQLELLKSTDSESTASERSCPRILQAERAYPTNAKPHARLRQQTVALAQVSFEAVHSYFTRVHSVEALDSFVSWHQHLVSSALNAFTIKGGVLDLFQGDTLFASFNASRPCAQRSSAALESVVGLVSGTDSSSAPSCDDTFALYCAVSTAKAACGDLGCPDMKRYTITGPAAATCSALSRTGAQWGLEVICDSSTHLNCFPMYEARLIDRMISVELISQKALYVWEIFTHTSASKDSGCEWMYEIEQSPGKRWEPYNAAVKHWLRGEPETALWLLEETERSVRETALPRACIRHMKSLRQRIQAGAHPLPVFVACNSPKPDFGESAEALSASSPSLGDPP